MEHLTKQQLILLALLVSFVTSLSTGIVTVSLMDQAPQGVTRTVSQVIERTIQAAVPQDAAVGSATTTSDPTADAVDQVRTSVVELKGAQSDIVTGFGLVVSKSGVIIADRNAIAGLGDYVAVLPGGRRVSVAVVQMQANGDIVFLAPSPATTTVAFSPIVFGSTPKLGSTALTLAGTSTPALGQGIVTEVVPADPHSSGNDQAHVTTTIDPSKIMLGSPLFGNDGSVVGISTFSLSKKDSASFYPISQLKTIIPTLR